MCVAHPEFDVVFADLGAQTDLFDLDGLLCLACLALSLGPLVQKLAIVHHPAHRWVGIGRNLNEVQPALPRHVERIAQGYHADHAIWPDEPYFSGSYPLIYSILPGGYRLLLALVTYLDAGRCNEYITSASRCQVWT